ncbi:MAG: SPASM domain-containing protein [Deltaproteobacteria bacterium]|nr:SPASM domain-containing protein [Deltaproteobacteria bacterium]
MKWLGLRRLLERPDPQEPGPRVFRAEAFGGIVQLAKPRALVFVDRDRARFLGYDGDRRWNGAETALGERPLSAPLEAHLQLTNRCGASCSGCYTAATPQGAAGEWGPGDWKRAIDALAEMGVFHLALGGGESAALPWLGEIAAHARSRGMIPNLTTSGLDGIGELLDIVHLFGQVNVSIDGVGPIYATVRGFDGFARADEAIRLLREKKREIGLNTVVTRHNFDHLADIFRYARWRRLSEIELLRFKPSGRGVGSYPELACTSEQHLALWPTLKRLLRRNPYRVRLDCSFTPMIACHDVDAGQMAQLAVYGCTGGDFLVAARATGTLTACSFAAPPLGKPRVDQIAEYWTQEDAFGPFREWRRAREPCTSCTYHPLCRGGCRVVSSHVLGDPALPDPECPRVVAHAKRVTLPLLR